MWELPHDYESCFSSYESHYGSGSFWKDYATMNYKDFMFKISFCGGVFGEIMECRRVYLFESKNDENKVKYNKGKELATEAQREWKKQESENRQGVSNEYRKQSVVDREYEYLRQKGLIK